MRFPFEKEDDRFTADGQTNNRYGYGRQNQSNLLKSAENDSKSPV